MMMAVVSHGMSTVVGDRSIRVGVSVAAAVHGVVVRVVPAAGNRAESKESDKEIFHFVHGVNGVAARGLQTGKRGTNNNLFKFCIYFLN